MTNSLPKDILAKCQFVLCGFDTNGMYREKDAQTGQIRERPIMPQETVWYRYEKVLTDNYKLVSQPYSSFCIDLSQIWIIHIMIKKCIEDAGLNLLTNMLHIIIILTYY